MEIPLYVGAGGGYLVVSGDGYAGGTLDFPNANGQKLAALLDAPVGTCRAERCSRIASPAARTSTPPSASPKA